MRAEQGAWVPFKPQSSTVRSAFPRPGNISCCALSSPESSPCRVSGPLSNWKREKALQSGCQVSWPCVWVPETLPEEAALSLHTEGPSHLETVSDICGSESEMEVELYGPQALEGRGDHVRCPHVPLVQARSWPSGFHRCSDHARPSTRGPHPGAQKSRAKLL